MCSGTSRALRWPPAALKSCRYTRRTTDGGVMTSLLVVRCSDDLDDEVGLLFRVRLAVPDRRRASSTFNVSYSRAVPGCSRR